MLGEATVIAPPGLANSEPLAVQACGEVHDTPSSSPPSAPEGSGVGRICQWMRQSGGAFSERSRHLTLRATALRPGCGSD